MNTPAPTPLPASVKQTVTLWLVAIGAGVFETILVVANVLWGDGAMANGEGLTAGVAARLVIFVAMTLVALQLRLGKHWARLTIGILLGLFGLLSLVIQPLSWLMEGHAVSEGFADLTLASAAFMLSRAVHMLTVVAATALMFVPTSNTFSALKVVDGQIDVDRFQIWLSAKVCVVLGIGGAAATRGSHQRGSRLHWSCWHFRAFGLVASCEREAYRLSLAPVGLYQYDLRPLHPICAAGLLYR